MVVYLFDFDIEPTVETVNLAKKSGTGPAGVCAACHGFPAFVDGKVGGGIEGKVSNGRV